VFSEQLKSVVAALMKLSLEIPVAGVTSKQQLEMIDGTPKKRLFLSIISDYDLPTGLCELIDNALDLWITNEKKTE